MFKIFKRKVEPELFFERGKKPKETLTQTAEKLLIRRMKKDPDGYGLQAAERIKNISRAEPKTLGDFLKELREYKSAMREAGLEAEKTQSIFSEIIQGLIKQAPEIIQVFRQNANIQANSEPALKEASPQELEQPKQLKSKKPKVVVKMEKIISLMSLSPEEAAAELKQLAIDGDQQGQLWLGLLSNLNYEGIVGLLLPMQEKPEYSEYVHRLLSPDRKEWIEKVLDCAKSAYNELKNAGK